MRCANQLSHSPTWFIELGTGDGIWGHLFLAFTWNLIYRVNNTSQICLSHMEWTDDALHKYFANTKTDQKGTQSKYSRHIYANPIEWVVYPIFYLGVYLGRFNNVAKGNSCCLFPGHNQFKRFSSILKQKPRKDSYLNKVLNQTTSACTV